MKLVAENLVSTSSPDDRNAPAALTVRAPLRPPVGVANFPAAPDPVAPAMSSWWDRIGDDPIDSRAEVHLGVNFVCNARSHVAWSRAKPSDLVLLGLFASRGTKRFPLLLVDAFHDLDQVAEEAGEEGFPEPSGVAVKNAADLLRQMFALSNRRYEIYPTPDGEVAIDAPDGHGQSVLVLCSSSGGVLCLVNMKTGHRRARYTSAETLPDGFIREALADLDRQDH